LPRHWAKAHGGDFLFPPFLSVPPRRTKARPPNRHDLPLPLAAGAKARRLGRFARAAGERCQAARGRGVVARRGEPLRGGRGASLSAVPASPPAHTGGHNPSAARPGPAPGPSPVPEV